METIQKLKQGTNGPKYTPTGVDYSNMKDIEKIALLKQLYSTAEQKGLPLLPYGDKALTPGLMGKNAMDPDLDDLLMGTTQGIIGNGYIPGAGPMISSPMFGGMPKTSWSHAYKHSKDPFVKQLVEHRGLDEASKIVDAYNVLRSDGEIDDRVAKAYELLTGESANKLYAKAEKHGIDIKGEKVRDMNIVPSGDGSARTGMHPRYVMAVMERSAPLLGRDSPSVSTSSRAGSTYSGSSKNNN